MEKGAEDVAEKKDPTLLKVESLSKTLNEGLEDIKDMLEEHEEMITAIYDHHGIRQKMIAQA